MATLFEFIKAMHTTYMSKDVSDIYLSGFREARGKFGAPNTTCFKGRHSSALHNSPFYRKDNKLFLKGLLTVSKFADKSPF
jgi:hypothetical protein